MECHSLQPDMEMLPVPAGTHWKDVKQQQLKSDIPTAEGVSWEFEAARTA